MTRKNRFVILLTDAERQSIDALAEAEMLPASTLARRCLLMEAEQRGVVSSRVANANRASVHQDKASAVA